MTAGVARPGTGSPVREGTRTAEILRLAAAGADNRAIALCLDVTPEHVGKVIRDHAPAPLVELGDATALAHAADKLRVAIAREAAAIAERRALARTAGGGTADAARAQLRLVRIAPRQAAGRDGCLRCGVRGDLGCRHQRPGPVPNPPSEGVHA